ncbi:MAG: glycosyltransferase family 4 protein [Proteobacteria bacterium]|nr:glycosyltransferase family 4 protein [Pseudomonadota bacterium]
MRCPMAQRTSKPIRVLFVGAFRDTAADGAVGGTAYASRSLVDGAPADRVTFQLLDSTMRSVPPPPVAYRAVFALRRLITVLGAFLFRRPDCALIFTSAGLSFVEKGAMALLGYLLGIPVVLAPRSGLMLDSLERSPAMRRYIRFVLRRCASVMCQGPGWKQRYQALTGLPDARFAVVPNWIDTSAYSAERDYHRSDRQTLRVLYLGWLERYKGILDLIAAVAANAGQLSHVRFVICGRGSLLAQARQQVHEAGLGASFEFAGWVTGQDKLAVLREADILVLPSHREGLPNALLEAMAVALPTVATRVGSIPDVVTDQETGLLIDAGDVGALGAALVRLTSDPALRQHLGQGARAAVVTHHDRERGRARVVELLERVSATRRRGK